jgi:hypothetical protein
METYIENPSASDVYVCALSTGDVVAEINLPPRRGFSAAGRLAVARVGCAALHVCNTDSVQGL